MTATVDVVIPSYNHRAFVVEAIDSALAQTLPPRRVVVVDDGSTDGSRELLQTMNRDGLVVHVQENCGAHAALGRGLDESDADFLFILNSDDVYSPERIERLVDELERRPAAQLATSWVEVVDAAGKRLGVKEAWRNLEPWPMPPRATTLQGTDDPRWTLLQQNWLATTSNFALRREAWQRLRPFRPLRYTHDWDFALRLAASAEITVVAEPLLRYRVHGSNTIREDLRAMELEILWTLAVNVPAFVAAADATPERLARLAASTHSFGHDGANGVRVLLQALAAAGDCGRARMERLLDPDDPLRRRLLERMA